MEKGIIKTKLSFIKILILGGIFFLCWNTFFKNAYAEQKNFDVAQKKIELNDNGLAFEFFSDAKNVTQLLSEQNITLGEHDTVSPNLEARIFSGSRIIILRAKKIIVKEGGKTNTFYTFQNTVEDAVLENKDIELDEDDVTVPQRNSTIKDGMTIVVTHVLVKEETKDVPIEFKTVTNEDDKLSWRTKKTTQKGEPGIKQIKYKVVFNDGKEITRKVLESNITKDPLDEIVTQGTMVKVGKTHTGAASWYAYTGTLAAANPWLPMGSYVRVINQDNGKSVIVKINDRGPFGNGRIIDLDKVAFAKIASIGAGVINVKMEVITN